MGERRGTQQQTAKPDFWARMGCVLGPGASRSQMEAECEAWGVVRKDCATGVGVVQSWSWDFVPR